MPKKPNYLIHAPSYDPNSGGSIFLHQLVHTLNQLGEQAFIWPWYRSPKRGLIARLGSIWRKPSLLLGYGRHFLNPALQTPLARFENLRPDSIVVYPEIRLGNPLDAKNVVRWLLYKPGLKDPFLFGENEMFFRVGEICDIPEITGGAPDLVLWTRHPAYRNHGSTDRSGACYLLRKGADKPRIPETANAICIDGKSHEEIAEIFNSCKTFYSYDEASFYSQFAALCGCESVVVPGMFGSREEWVREHRIARHGVAYGVDDLAHARETMHRVKGLLAEKEAESLKSVRSFVIATQKRFSA